MAEDVDISVVVPVYKEEASVVPFLRRIEPVLEGLGSHEIIFALDPGDDRTETVVREQIERNPAIGLIVFSRRFGQPAATLAGIHECRGRACVVIDIDLQDPPELIPELVAKLQDGYDVVYAKRRSRQGETLLKRAVSHLGYKLIAKIADVPIPEDTGDFRIMSRRVVDELCRLTEGHGFLRGMVAYVGFNQTAVEYDRAARAFGQSAYNPFTGSLKIAFNGIFGFSTYPLSFLLWSGLSLAALSLLAIAVMMFNKFVIGFDYPMGIPTITVLVLFLGGVQLMAIGVMGEYVGRIYGEVRRRAPYIIARSFNMRGGVEKAGRPGGLASAQGARPGAPPGRRARARKRGGAGARAKAGGTDSNRT